MRSGRASDYPPKANGRSAAGLTTTRRKQPTLPKTNISLRLVPWGDDAPDTTRANLLRMACGPQHRSAHIRAAKCYGCQQLIGDVWEWTI